MGSLSRERADIACCRGVVWDTTGFRRPVSTNRTTSTTSCRVEARVSMTLHFHYPPTHASWLNQIEVWFSMLTRAVWRHLSATDPRQVRQAIDRFTDVRNEHPIPFEWTKSVVHPGTLKKRYADLCD